MQLDIVKENVLRELRFDPRVDANKIGVSFTDENVLVLGGKVDSLYEKAAAVQAAKRVFGVSAIANEIDVEVPGHYRGDDAKLAQWARERLAMCNAVPPGAVTVTATDGWLALTGKVDHHFQKKAASQEVESIPGVSGVFNNLEVVPVPSPGPEVIRKEIEEALVRHARIDATGIQVTVDGDRVVLEGTVHSWAERDEVEDAAWSLRGINDVEDRLEIVPWREN